MAKEKKKRKWIIIVCAVIAVIIIGAVGSGEDSENDTEVKKDTVTVEQSEASIESTSETTTEATTLGATLGEINALKKAESYLRMGGFSKEALKKQLDFEGFEKSEVEYALKNCDADWNEQCVDKAKSYINMGGFSKSGLREQLDFEGFTEEQINYALKEVGY